MLGKLWQWLRRGTIRTSGYASWFVDWIRGGQESASGVKVDGKSALTYAPVWYAVNKIAGHMGQMPLVLNKRLGERRKARAKEHRAYRLLKKRPNALMTASVFKELLQYHALVWGNGRAVIGRDNAMRPLDLVPLLPDRTVTVLVNGEKWHVTEIVIDEHGQTEKRKFRDRDVLHIVGLGFDGIVGYPLWELAKDSFGLGLATEKHGARHFKQYAMPGLLLEAPAGVFPDDEEARKFLMQFREMHEGLDNTGKTALLREGIKATALAQNNVDSQMLETRQFQRQEVALWFLLEQILGDDSSVSYNSLEQKNLAYLSNCLGRWLVKWEEECDEKLLTEKEKRDDSHFFKFVTAGLLRADFGTTITTLRSAIEATIMNPNEARDVLDWDEREGGDVYENPNTKARGNNQAQMPNDQEDEDQAGKLKQRLQALITDRIEELLAVERQRVTAAAAKPGKFLAWLDEFYAEASWPKTLARVIGACGGPEQLAAKHCARSREELLAIAGQATAENLATAVAVALQKWSERGQQLAANISGE